MYADQFLGWTEDDIREELTRCHPSTEELASVYQQALFGCREYGEDFLPGYLSIIISFQNELGKREEYQFIVKKFKKVFESPEKVLYVGEVGCGAEVTQSLIKIATQEKRKWRKSVIEEELLCPAGIRIRL